MDVNNNQQSTVREKADAALKAGRAGHNKRQLVIWILALAIGAGLGWMGNSALNELFNFIAQVYTRLFQFRPFLWRSLPHWRPWERRRIQVRFSAMP